MGIFFKEIRQESVRKASAIRQEGKLFLAYFAASSPQVPASFADNKTKWAHLRPSWRFSWPQFLRRDSLVRNFISDELGRRPYDLPHFLRIRSLTFGQFP